MGIIFISDNLEALIGVLEDLTYEIDASQYNGWYCINIKPFKCQCNQIVCYAIAGPHLILVWETKDDDTLLELAANLEKGDYEPRIVSYHEMLGPCITVDEAIKHGWIESIVH